MAQSCPLAFRQIDGTVARLNALTVMALLSFFVALPNPLILLFLGVDFMVRLYGNKVFSPVNQLSKGIRRVLGLKSAMVDAGAKRLAAHFGLLFVLLSLAANLAGATLLMYSAVALFMFCLALEMLFGYCIGCKIYFIYRKFVPEKV